MTPHPLAFLPAIAEQLINHQLPVIVTGAGGWLGMAALEMLESALGDNIHTQVRAVTTNPGAVKLRSGRNLMTSSFTAIAHTPAPPSLILHLAFLTRGHAATMPLASYISANQAITKNLTKLIERHGTLGLFVPSSGAVYGHGGQLDEDLAGNPYGVLKRRDEEEFVALGQRLGYPAAVIRIFNIAGPYINNLKSYALATILTDIAQGGPIRLRARQPVWRSYTHVADVMNVALTILLNNIASPVFDTAGESMIEIGDLARRAATLCGAISILIERPEIDLQTADQYAGDGEVYHALAADFGIELQKLDACIIDTHVYINESICIKRSSGWLP